MSEILSGMGAIVHANGVAFRVWAPNAQAVYVKGDFNNWSDQKNPLNKEENGYWYATINNAHCGQEYKFVIINGDQILDKSDPYTRQMNSSSGNSVIYDPSEFDWQNDNFSIPALNELVIYEIHIGSFFADKQGIAGDFDMALQKLNHLKQLGVNALQVMPVGEFPGDFSWGYNPANIFAVESAYGGPDQMKRFVQKAHQEGFAVILDVVYNHFGPSDLDLWQFDGWQENDKGGIYFYNDERAVTPWGDNRPDYGRAEVRQFIRDNALMWLQEYHVDGLRFDSTLYIRTIDGDENHSISEGWSLLQQITSEIRIQFPNRILIAEDLRSNSFITKSAQEQGAGFHSQWDAKFVHPIRDIVEQTQDENRSMETLKNAILFNFDKDAFRRIIYSESHDEVANGKQRVPQEVDPQDPSGWYSQKRSTLAAGLVFTAPGIPMLFQGQEFLQGDWFRDDVPLDWHLDDKFRGIVRLYCDLIHLRLNQQGFSRGLCGQFTNIYHMNEADNVVAYQRWDQHGRGDDVVIIANFSHVSHENYEIGMPTPGLWKLRLNSDATIYSKDFNGCESFDMQANEESRDGLAAKATITIGSYSLLIYSQDRQ